MISHKKPLSSSTIILTTFNARYTHTSLGLRYLYANMKALQPYTKIREFIINSQVPDAAEKILAEKPKIVGIGAYIWNATEVSELIVLLKSIAPEVIIVLGGPEAGYMPHRVDFSQADYIIQGEGDVAFGELCTQLLDGEAPETRFIKAPMVDMNAIVLPYEYYTDHDVAHRYVYVEASRGCPYRCEFCLSSLDKKIRNVDLDVFMRVLERLWDRGVRNFRFIDRTFNQGITRANAILDFFLSKEPPYFAHFEVIPDNFPASLRERISKFPPSVLQLEVGIQTLDEVISKKIYRPLKLEKIKENLEYLQTQTKAHIHVDLIVGLPSESVEQFARNLNQLHALVQCEIQIGILKKLSGTTIDRHDEEEGMVYSSKPPYDILQNNCIDFTMMQKMKRFARFWDLVYNSGNFKRTVDFLWKDGLVFEGFFAFSEWIYEQTESTWQISLDRLAKLLYTYLLDALHVDEKLLKEVLTEDIMSVEGRKLPKFLYVEIPEVKVKKTVMFNTRQQKHATFKG